MWVDYRGPLSTVYSDGEMSTCVSYVGLYICTFESNCSVIFRLFFAGNCSSPVNVDEQTLYV